MKKLILFLSLFVAVTAALTVTAFAETTEDGLLTYTVTDGKAEITGITDRAYEGALTLPDDIDGCPVVSVNGDFFDGLCGYVTTLTLPSMLGPTTGMPGSVCIVERFSIAESNPYFSTDDVGVLFNKDQTVLYRYPMVSPCTEYAIPDTVTELAANAFQNSNYLEHLIVPGSIENIPTLCFALNYALKTIELGEGVKRIEENGIAECRNMERVILPSTLETIENSGISGCHKMKELIVPASVRKIIGSLAIGDNRELERVVFLGAPEWIDREVMERNNSLREVWFTGSEEEWNANEDLSSLKLYGATLRCGYVYAKNAAMRFESGVLTVSGAEALPAVAEGGFTDWTDHAPDCDVLRLGESVKRVGGRAFAGFSELSEIVIYGDGVTVAADAFIDCGKLDTVVAFGDITFENGDLPENAVVYAPAGAAVVGARERVVRFSLADGVLTLDGAVFTDAYTFLDVVAALCDRLGTVEKICVSSLSLDGVEFYYLDENGRRCRVEDDTLVNGTIAAGAPTADGGDRALTFNELCEGIADGTLTEFYFSTATEEHGENIDTPVEIDDREDGNENENENGGGRESFIRRILKAIVTLLNRLFRFLKNLGK